MPRANFQENVAPTCSCADPWACTRRFPHRSWNWRISQFISDESGRRYRPSGSGHTTESAARRAAEDAMADYRNARRVDDGGSTIRELFDWWLLEKRKRRPALSSNTLNGYVREADAWCAHIGTTKGDSLKYGQVNEALEIMGRRRDPQNKPEGFHGRWVEKLSIESLHRRQSILRNMLNFALLHGRISKNVAAGRMSALGESLDSTTEDEDVWTEELSGTGFETRWGPTQTAEFLDRLVGHKWETLFTLYVYTAARRAEWLGARRAAIKNNGLTVAGTVRIVSRQNATDGLGVCPVCKEQHTGRVLVQRTKNLTTTKGPVKTRWIPVPTEGIELLNRHLASMDEHRKKTGSDFVDHFLIFSEDDGSPIHPGAITTEFGRLIREAGLPTIRLHDLRHNAASLFLAAGVPVEVVAKMTGHDVVILREIYHHISPELTADMFQRANDTVTRLREASSAAPTASVEALRTAQSRS